ncbi:hypothetical protein C3K47_02090 [Solitalea longa]|uniref:YdhG-like domain-containing protein n=1 Tax=Solitalea longa TaxID=2079460 RepID=A0A2S5A9P7_9SPHI|nr:DUF1801 domain-containing protein [Solitalea longa]POY39310.1 hypothetical protein C3K47_02090 [Solitalea longa]
MNNSYPLKIQSIAHLFDVLPENERLIVDILRQIIHETLPNNCKEKIAFNVPYYYGKKGICIVWPARIPRGGIKEGVLLGFWYGNKLADTDNYLTHGTNKQIFYKIYKSPEEIDQEAIVKLLNEAIQLDNRWGIRKSGSK